MTARAEAKKEVNNNVGRTAEAPSNMIAVNATDDLFQRFASLTSGIAERAYELFRERGGELGRERDDWFKAENELLRPVPIELSQTDNTITVKAAAAGFKPDEIEVSVEGNTLVINGISTSSTENEDGDTVLREWNSNRFCRQVLLPSRVDVEKITAELTDGMLKIVMPKEMAPESRTVPVTSA